VGTGGNIGTPALDLLIENNIELYVLELSSFQLERLPDTCQFAAATVLNITNDHMDRYASFEEYVKAKQKVYLNSACCVYNREDAYTKPERESAKSVSVGLSQPDEGFWGLAEIEGERVIVCGQTPLIACQKLSLQGPHNELNAMTAAALARSIGVSDDAICSVLESFEGLAHRCQTVRQVGGVTFVNDSKATNVGACLAALQRFYAGGMPVVLIAGGDGKNADFSLLRDAVAKGVKKLVLLGEDAPALQEALGDLVCTHRVADMAEAVQAANDEAESGDVVLLAPACASFDMYANFAQRGEDFERRVQAVNA
jgi:UDP-N-acetylmuramoylalanine--D-glutamate ligase